MPPDTQWTVEDAPKRSLVSTTYETEDSYCANVDQGREAVLSAFTDGTNMVDANGAIAGWVDWPPEVLL